MKPRANSATQIIFAAIVAFATLGIGSYESASNAEWAFDGYIYGIRAQVYAGIPYTVALNNAREIYRSKPAMQRQAARRKLAASMPPWWDLFAIRAVYPALGSLLWRYAGFHSLFYISIAAYVAAALLVYAMLLRFCLPAVAATVSLTCMLHPEAQYLARSDLTDMLAFAFLAAALLSAMRYAQRGGWANIACFVCAAILLTFSRPVPYVLAAAAAPLVLTAAWKRGAELVAVSLALCVVVALVMHLSGGSVPPVGNYARSVAETAWITLVLLVKSILAPVAVIALVAMRKRADVLIACGALASIVLTILADPYPNDVPRVIVFPALIPLACGFAIAAQSSLVAGRASGAGMSILREWSGSESILAARKPKSSRLA